jgi:hypothetical protein
MTAISTHRRISSRWATVTASAALAVLTAAVYWPAVGFDFVNWDDPWYVTENPLVRSWSRENLADIATEPVARNYAPLTILSFLVDHTLWGDNPAGYHLTNILLHAACAVLVFLLLRQLGGGAWLAWAAAALFALHPVQVETVAWVSSRKGLLCGVFMLGSLLCWLRDDRQSKHELLGLLLLGAALLSKALAVVTPAIVLSYDLLIRRQKLSDALPRQIIPGLLSLWLLSVTTGAQVTIVGGTRDHLALSKPELLAVDAVILWRYVGMLLWPHDLCVLYDPPTTGIALPAALAILGWLAVTVAAWKLRRTLPHLAFGLTCCLLLLLPVLNLFPLTTLINDRYLYLPCIPLFALAAAGARAAWPRLAPAWCSWVARPESAKGVASSDRSEPRPSHTQDSQGVPPGRVSLQTAAATLTTVAVIALAVAGTRARLPVWRDGLSLWADAVQKTPGLTVVQIQWANTLHDAGRDAEAAAALNYALAHCEPDEIDRARIHEKLRAWGQ